MVQKIQKELRKGLLDLPVHGSLVSLLKGRRLVAEAGTGGD